MLGQNSYSLTCSVSVSENLNPSVTYQWTKKNSIQMGQLVFGNSSSLSFSRLQPSDAGQYSCNVAVLSAYLSSVVYASKSFEVTIISMFQNIINEHGPILGHYNFAYNNYDIIQCHAVPEPAVSIHSDSLNPILSGSSPTLTCSVEMKSTVNVPVAVSMEWTGPDGTAIMPIARPEMISFTLYSSSIIPDSVELADSGEYTCAAKIENEPEMSTSTNITIGNFKPILMTFLKLLTVDGVFQLRLKSVGICQHWHSEISLIILCA